jgi:hypothetical protein
LLTLYSAPIINIMKIHSHSLATLVAFSALTAASLSAQTRVIDFTDGSLTDGSLQNNADWFGGGPNYVVSSGTGLLVADAVGNNRTTFTTTVSGSETQFTMATVFSFSETALAGPGSNFGTVFQFGFSGSESLFMGLTRKTDPSTYQLQFSRGSETGSTHNGGLFAGSLMGLDFANDDFDSDQLLMTFTLTKGATDAATWRSSTRLFNLATDPMMSGAIASQNNLVVNPTAAFFGEDLSSFLNSNVSNTLGNMSGLTIESLSITPLTPVPEPSAFAAIAGALALGLVAIRRRR